MGGGLESRCVGRVCCADVAVRVARQHPHSTACKYALYFERTAAQYSALNPENKVASCTPTRYPTNSSKHASRNAGFHRTALRHTSYLSARLQANNIASQVAGDICLYFSKLKELGY